MSLVNDSFNLVKQTTGLSQDDILKRGLEYGESYAAEVVGQEAVTQAKTYGAAGLAYARGAYEMASTMHNIATNPNLTSLQRTEQAVVAMGAVIGAVGAAVGGVGVIAGPIFVGVAKVGIAVAKALGWREPTRLNFTPLAPGRGLEWQDAIGNRLTEIGRDIRQLAFARAGLEGQTPWHVLAQQFNERLKLPLAESQDGGPGPGLTSSDVANVRALTEDERRRKLALTPAGLPSIEPARTAYRVIPRPGGDGLTLAINVEGEHGSAYGDAFMRRLIDLYRFVFLYDLQTDLMATRTVRGGSLTFDPNSGQWVETPEAAPEERRRRAEESRRGFATLGRHGPPLIYPVETKREQQWIDAAKQVYTDQVFVQNMAATMLATIGAELLAAEQMKFESTEEGQARNLARLRDEAAKLIAVSKAFGSDGGSTVDATVQKLLAEEHATLVADGMAPAKATDAIHAKYGQDAATQFRTTGGPGSGGAGLGIALAGAAAIAFLMLRKR